MRISQLSTAPETMMDLSPDGFAFVKADETIAEANEAFCRLLGGRRGSLVGRRLKEIGGIDRLRDVIAKQVRHMGSRPNQGIFEMEHPSGSSTYLLRMRPVFGSRGDYRGIALSVADISVAAGQRAAARESNALRDELLARLSRCLAEPIGEVVGALNRLYDTGLRSTQFGHLEVARKNTHTMEDLIGLLDDFHRLETGCFVLAEDSFGFEKVLEGVLRDLGSAAREKSADLTFCIGDGIDFELCGDEARLRQVITALVRTLLESSDSAHIGIDAQLVGRSKDHVAIRVEVASEGVDIEKRKLGKGVARGNVEARLELLVAKRIVQLMGGSFGVHQTKRGGDAIGFFVRLRPSRQTPTTGRDSRSSNPRWGGRVVGVRVLIVDDDGLARQVLSRLLNRYGYTVDSVRGLDEAQRALEANRYHVILLATEIDGKQFDVALGALEEIWNREGVGAPTVVGLQAGPADWEGAGKGVVATLRKPLGPKKLLDTLDRCLSNRLSSRASMEESLLPTEYREEDFKGIEVLDGSGCLSRLGGNTGLLEQLTTEFITRTGPTALAGIAEAARAGDFEELGRRAHALCGSAASVGAARISRISANVETMCRQGSLDEPDKWATVLKKSFRLFVERALECADEK